MAAIDDRDIAVETCGLSGFLKMVLDGEFGRIWHLSEYFSLNLVSIYVG